MGNRALIVVDVQNDFCEGGSLAVRGGNSVAAAIRKYLNKAELEYDLIINTQDWHINPKGHFSNDPDFKDTWPVHCQAGQFGSLMHRKLAGYNFDYTIKKGQWEAAYSGFEGFTDDTIQASLRTLFERVNIDEVDVCGLALDYCVLKTAQDAHFHGYRTKVLAGLTAAVHNDRATVVKTINGLRDYGVTVK